MPLATHRVRALTLAREEIRTLPRQTFALGAVAVVLALFAPLAALALEGPSAFQEYLLFLWVIGELVVAIFLAARIASARRTRFVDSLYTTPLQARTWLAAQLLVGAFLAGLVIVAQIPFILVYSAFVGIPPYLPEVFLAAVAVGVCAIALGAFCGVIVGNAGAGAAAGLAGGFGFLSFLLLVLHAAMALGPLTAMKVTVLRLSGLSPMALAVDATGLDVFESAPTEPWRALVGLGAIVVGLGGAAWLAYTRAQGPLGWEPRGSRAPIVALVALALVVPVATASVSFQKVDDGDGPVFMHGERTRIGLVERGAPITDDAFTMFAAWQWDPLVHGKDNERDLLVMVLAEGEAIRNVRIQVEGSKELLVISGGQRTVADGKPDGQARVGESFSQSAEPTGPLRPVYRVPVTLRPVEASAVLDSPGLVEIETRFTSDGRAQESLARMTLGSDMPGASATLLLAGAPLPLAALAALVTRRIKTR